MTLDRLWALTRNLQATATLGRETVTVGPFRAFFSRDSRDYLLSVAFPIAESDDWPGAVAALMHAVNSRERTLRLEYFAECFPTLTPVLEVTGIKRESAAQVMVLDAGALQVRPMQSRTRVDFVRPDDEHGVSGLLSVLTRCFDLGTSDGVTGWRTILRTGLSDGTIQAALARVDGEIVGGANLLIGGGAAELAGVGTLPAYRRRGIAAGLCYRLLADHFAQGHRVAWLSSTQDLRPLYDRLGFKRIGTQLNYGLKRI